MSFCQVAFIIAQMPVGLLSSAFEDYKKSITFRVKVIGEL